MCPCLHCFNTRWHVFLLIFQVAFQRCPSGVTGAHFGTGSFLLLWSKRINGRSAANLSCDQTNSENSSFYSSIPESKICFRCFVWSSFGKTHPDIISLSNCRNYNELWITSWWLLRTKKFWKKNPVLVIATSHKKGWMSLQWRKYSSMCPLKCSVWCWKHEAGMNNGTMVTCDFLIFFTRL